jgi:leader peptidase (prepilin peptidase) / N-methyltransferase
MTPVWPVFFAFVAGASIGSFLNVCIVRWPAERSIVRPRSRCPRCTNALAWY